MKTEWQLQEAKNRLSHVVAQARTHGPQTITIRGRPAVVVVSVETYARQTRPTTSLVEFFQQSPLHGLDIDLERSADIGREIDL